MTDETLKLMADRFDDLQKYLDDKFADNKSDHEGLAKRQDHTNGDVKSLKLWVAGIIGGVSVVVSLFMFFRPAIMEVIGQAVLSQLENKYEITIKDE